MSNQKKFFKVFAWIFFAFLATLMLSFGIDPTSVLQENKNYAAKVNDQEIPIQEFYRRHEQLQSIYKQQFKEAYAQIASQLNLKQQAMDAIITDHLLTVLTNNIGLTADKGHIEERILSHPYFEGGYSEQAYQSFLRATGMTGGQLERQVRTELVREQITEMFKHASKPTDAELKAVYSDENTKIALNYIEIEADKFKDKVKIDNEEKLEEFFEEKKNSYRQAKQLQFSYVAFEPEKFKDTVEINPEDIKAAYSERVSEFIEPREVRVRQIFIAKPEKKEEGEIPFLEEEKKDNGQTAIDDPVELARQRATEILQRLDDGEDFVKLAKEKSEDEITKKDGGDIGFSKLSELTPEVGNAVKDLGVGEYSELVETEKAFYIFQLAQDKPSREKPLEEVKAELEQIIRQNDAPLYAMEEAEVAKEIIQEKQISLSDYFKDKEGFKVVATGKLVDFNSAGAGVEKQLFGAISKFNEGEREVVDISGTPYLVSIQKVKESYIPALKEVRAQVEKDYIVQEQKFLAKDFAEGLAVEIKNAGDGISLAELAKKHDLKVQTTDAASKKQPGGTGPLGSFEVRKKAFNLDELNKPIADNFEFQQKFYLVELASKELPDEKDFQAEVETLRNSEQSQASNRLMRALVADLRAKADIKVNDALLGQNS